jgi:hypothetical protein
MARKLLYVPVEFNSHPGLLIDTGSLTQLTNVKGEMAEAAGGVLLSTPALVAILVWRLNHETVCISTNCEEALV